MTDPEIKQKIRASMLAKRDALTLKEKEDFDNTLHEKLGKLIANRKPKIIHSYLPMGSEINVLPLLQSLMEKGLTIVCPKSLPNRKIENRLLKSLEELEDGRFGTKHPFGEKFDGDIDLFIVPGLAFDKSGNRVGYGAGYYDTLFANDSKGYKVGVCYDFQICETIPSEPHDVRMDEVV